MIKEMLKRLKFGYPISIDFREKTICHDQLEIWYKEEKCFDVFTETMVDNVVIIYNKNPPIHYKNTKIPITVDVWQMGIRLLLESYRKRGIRATLSEES